MWVSCYCLSISDVYCWWAFVMVVCTLYPLYLWWSLCPVHFVCVCVLVFHLGGVIFGCSVTGSQTCLVTVACHCDGNCPWHCDILLYITRPSRPHTSPQYGAQLTISSICILQYSPSLIAVFLLFLNIMDIYEETQHHIAWSMNLLIIVTHLWSFWTTGKNSLNIASEWVTLLFEIQVPR